MNGDHVSTEHAARQRETTEAMQRPEPMADTRALNAIAALLRTTPWTRGLVNTIAAIVRQTAMPDGTPRLR